MVGFGRCLWRSPSPTFCSSRTTWSWLLRFMSCCPITKETSLLLWATCPQRFQPTSPWIRVFLCLNEGFHILIYAHCLWSFFWAEGKTLNSLDLLAVLCIMQLRTLCFKGTVLARVHLLVHQISQVFLLECLCISWALLVHQPCAAPCLWLGQRAALQLRGSDPGRNWGYSALQDVLDN